MSLYMNFFSPPTVCTIICLHNAVTRTTEHRARETELLTGEGDYKVLDFLVDKIMEQSVSSGARSLAEYENDILSTIQDKDLVVRLNAITDSIADLNSFYKVLYRTI